MSTTHLSAPPSTEGWTVEAVELLVALGVNYKPAPDGSSPSMRWETTTPQGRLIVSGYQESGCAWWYFVTYWDDTPESGPPRLSTRDLREVYAKVADILNAAS